MIVRHITFTVEPAKGAAFERFFAEQYKPAAAVSPGYVQLELLRAADDPAHYEMTFEWVDGDAAAGWRNSAVHEGLQPELKSISTMGAIRVYSVVG